MNFILKNNIRLGIAIWIFWTIWNLPHPLENLWGKMLVLLAPLVVVPLILEIKNNRKNKSIYFSKINQWQLPAALFFTLAYCFPKNIWAGLFTIPWLFFTLFLFIESFLYFKKNINHSNFINWTAFGFLFIGAIWAVFDRFGIRPLDFNPEIVFLTVAHFHYAGFVLTSASGWTKEKLKNKWLGKIIAHGIISGVILVAAGIINSRLGGSPTLEFLAAWWMAISAVILAIVHINFSLKKNCPPRATLYWSLAGIFLIGGMTLAGLYGMRHIWAFPGLDIAWMQALHGSANVFGFSLFSVLGWQNYFQSK